MNFSPRAIQDFRNRTNALKPMNFPRERECKFCGKLEVRSCMKNNRCRSCYAGRP